MLIPGEDDNTLENFGPNKNYKSTLKKQNIEKDYRNLIEKSLDTRNHVKNGLSGYTYQDRLFTYELSLFLKEIKFSKQKFFIGKPISNIKYPYLRSQNNNLFISFNN